MMDIEIVRLEGIAAKDRRDRASVPIGQMDLLCGGHSACYTYTIACGRKSGEGRGSREKLIGRCGGLVEQVHCCALRRGSKERSE